MRIDQDEKKLSSDGGFTVTARYALASYMTMNVETGHEKYDVVQVQGKAGVQSPSFEHFGQYSRNISILNTPYGNNLPR